MWRLSSAVRSARAAARVRSLQSVRGVSAVISSCHQGTGVADHRRSFTSIRKKQYDIPRFPPWIEEERKLERKLKDARRRYKLVIEARQGQLAEDEEEAAEYNRLWKSKRDELRSRIKECQSKIYNIRSQLGREQKELNRQYAAEKKAIRDSYLADRRQLLLFDLKRTHDATITPENFNQKIMDAFLFPPNYNGVYPDDVTAPGSEKMKWQLRHIMPAPVGYDYSNAQPGDEFMEPWAADSDDDPEHETYSRSIASTGVLFNANQLEMLRRAEGFEEENYRLNQRGGRSPEEEQKLIQKALAENPDKDWDMSLADVAKALGGDPAAALDFDVIRQRARALPSTDEDRERIAQLAAEHVEIHEDGRALWSPQAPPEWPQGMEWPPPELVRAINAQVGFSEHSSHVLSAAVSKQGASLLDYPPVGWKGTWPVQSLEELQDIPRPDTWPALEPWPPTADSVQDFAEKLIADSLKSSPDQIGEQTVIPPSVLTDNQEIQLTPENVDATIDLIASKAQDIQKEISDEFEEEKERLRRGEPRNFMADRDVEIDRETDASLEHFAALIISMQQVIAAKLGVSMDSIDDDVKALADGFKELYAKKEEHLNLRKMVYETTLDHIREVYETVQSQKRGHAWDTLPRKEQIAERDEFIVDTLMSTIPQPFRQDLAEMVFNLRPDDPFSIIKKVLDSNVHTVPLEEPGYRKDIMMAEDAFIDEQHTPRGQDRVLMEGIMDPYHSTPSLYNIPSKIGPSGELQGIPSYTIPEVTGDVELGAHGPALLEAFLRDKVDKETGFNDHDKVHESDGEA